MPDQKDPPDTIAGRELIAKTPDLRVQILTLSEGQEIPWHHHTAVTDTVICLQGPMLVETRNADGDHELAPAASSSCKGWANSILFRRLAEPCGIARNRAKDIY